MEMPNTDSAIRGEIKPKPAAQENGIAASQAQKTKEDPQPAQNQSVTVSISQEAKRLAREASANEDANTSTDRYDDPSQSTDNAGRDSLNSKETKNFVEPKTS